MRRDDRKHPHEMSADELYNAIQKIKAKSPPDDPRFMRAADVREVMRLQYETLIRDLPHLVIENDEALDLAYNLAHGLPVKPPTLRLVVNNDTNQKTKRHVPR